jgi:hypothetical protein
MVAVANAKPAQREGEPKKKLRMIFPDAPGVFADRARVMSRRDFILLSFTQVFDIDKEDYLCQVAAQVYMPVGDARRLLADLQKALAGTEEQEV